MNYYDEVEMIVDKKTKKTYVVQHLDNGKSVKTEVNPKDKWVVELKEYLRVTNNKKRKDRYWTTISLDALEYEGEQFATYDNYAELDFYDIRFTKALAQLTATQRRRLMLKYDNPEYSYRDIAKIEHTSATAIALTFEQIRNIFKKFKIAP